MFDSNYFLCDYALSPLAGHGIYTYLLQRYRRLPRYRELEHH